MSTHYLLTWDTICLDTQVIASTQTVNTNICSLHNSDCVLWEYHALHATWHYVLCDYIKGKLFISTVDNALKLSTNLL